MGNEESSVNIRCRFDDHLPLIMHYRAILSEVLISVYEPVMLMQPLSQEQKPIMYRWTDNRQFNFQNSLYSSHINPPCHEKKIIN